MLYTWLRYGKPDISMTANGLLAGLVAITAPCAFVTAPSAVLIGLIAGVLLCWAVVFVERTLKIDDPVGAISVHGFNGAWGVFSVGLFADGSYGDAFNGVKGTVTGLFYGDAGQFAAQCIGIATNLVYVGAIGYRRVQTPGRRHRSAGRRRTGIRRSRSVRGGGHRLPGLPDPHLASLSMSSSGRALVRSLPEAALKQNAALH